MDAMMAPSETYFVIKKTIKNIANEISAVSKLIAKMIPKVVATPLPPRKFANSGKHVQLLHTTKQSAEE